MVLLTGEYASTLPGSSSSPLLVGRGLVRNASNSCIPSGLSVSFIGVFPGFFAPVGEYSTGIDIGWRQEFSLGLGLGEVATFDSQLVYYRRSVGTPLTCGSPAGFANLLSIKAAQAAALATPPTQPMSKPRSR